MWTDQHSANLQHCLDNTPLIANLSALRPEIEGNTLEDKAMSASVVEGYELCMKKIVELSQAKNAPHIKSPFIQGLDKFEERAEPIQE
jgi:hypothetical protein